jgi:hypothetical protein
VDLLLLRCYVLDGNLFLDGCNDRMLGRDMTLRGMSVLIVFCIGVVIVVYVTHCEIVDCRL